MHGIASAATILEALACGQPGCECARGKKTHCPGHHDPNPSLGVDERDGKALVHCYAGCEQEPVLAALVELGLWPRADGEHRNGTARPSRALHDGPTYRLVKTYRICNEGGSVVALHERGEGPDHGKHDANGAKIQQKRMFWRLPGRDGYGLGGLQPSALPLYGSEHLLGLPDRATVVLGEGEPAADAVRALGVPAVGTVTGAGGMPSDDVLRPLLRFNIVLWPDEDTK